MHHARWMSKAIYSLKIFLLRDTFPLKSKERESLAIICVFIVKIYIKIWFTAASPVKAPNCDFQLIKSLHDFQIDSKKISEAALNKILNHLWSLNPENCVMALFDEDVDLETKQKMVTKLLCITSSKELYSSNDEEIRVPKKVVISHSDIPKVLEQ